ncbi:MAG: hypothetical protein LBT59_02095 [Clostridiales bacterium]|nr:hypothetical protein [Clostridiales bacterium]
MSQQSDNAGDPFPTPERKASINASDSAPKIKCPFVATCHRDASLSAPDSAVRRPSLITLDKCPVAAVCPKRDNCKIGSATPIATNCSYGKSCPIADSCPTMKANKEHIALDTAAKLLMGVSSLVLISLVNSFFKRNYRFTNDVTFPQPPLLEDHIEEKYNRFNETVPNLFLSIGENMFTIAFFRKPSEQIASKVFTKSLLYSARLNAIYNWRSSISKLVVPPTQILFFGQASPLSPQTTVVLTDERSDGAQQYFRVLVSNPVNLEVKDYLSKGAISLVPFSMIKHYDYVSSLSSQERAGCRQELHKKLYVDILDTIHKAAFRKLIDPDKDREILIKMTNLLYDHYYAKYPELA